MGAQDIHNYVQYTQGLRVQIISMPVLCFQHLTLLTISSIVCILLRDLAVDTVSFKEKTQNKKLGLLTSKWKNTGIFSFLIWVSFLDQTGF